MNEPRTMTVGELMDRLDDFPKDMPVLISFEYGDYWKNIVADQLDFGDVEVGAVTWSDYHRMWKLIDSEPEDDDPELDDEPHEVLIIGPQPGL